nr:MAG TPA: hypothetical protein [Caudoviricetes sp.]
MPICPYQYLQVYRYNSNSFTRSSIFELCALRQTFDTYLSFNNK